MIDQHIKQAEKRAKGFLSSEVGALTRERERLAPITGKPVIFTQHGRQIHLDYADIKAFERTFNIHFYVYTEIKEGKQGKYLQIDYRRDKDHEGQAAFYEATEYQGLTNLPVIEL